MSVRWKLESEMKVLQCDYRGLCPDLSLLQLEQATCVLGRCDGGILLLSTFGSDEVDHQFVRRVHDLGKRLARGAASKVALVGINRLKYVMREAFVPLTGGEYPSFFESEQEALEWLVNGNTNDTSRVREN